MRPISTSRNNTSETTSDQKINSQQSSGNTTKDKSPRLSSTKKNRSTSIDSDKEALNHLDQLKKAIKEGDCKTTIDILKKYPSLINFPDPVTDETPLMRACGFRQKDIVEGLLKLKDLNINAQAKDGKTALHTAINANQQEIIAILLENSADPFIVNQYGLNPTAMAASFGYIDSLKTMHLCGIDLDTPNSKLNNQTPLMMAAANGHSDTVQYLISHSDTSRKDSDGKTALMHAIENGKGTGHAELGEFGLCIDWLVTHGAQSIALKDNFGKNAFMYAIEQENLHVLEKLSPHVDINAKDHNNKAALYLAVEGDKKYSIEFLLKNFSDKLDKTPALSPTVLAAARGNTKLLKSLIDSGISLKNSAYEKEDAFVAAAKNNRGETLEYLIKKFKPSTEALAAAAIAAAGEGSIDCLRALKNYSKATFTQPNKDGLTPWVAAIDSDRIEVIKYLLKHGMNFFEQYSGRLSAFAIAADRNRTQMVELLLKSAGKKIVIHYNEFTIVRDFMKKNPSLSHLYAEKTFLNPDGKPYPDFPPKG